MDLTDGASVLSEHALADSTQADYVLCDRQLLPMAALEAKRASTDPVRAQDQGRHYACFTAKNPGPSQNLPFLR